MGVKKKRNEEEEKEVKEGEIYNNIEKKEMKKTGKKNEKTKNKKKKLDSENKENNYSLNKNYTLPGKYTPPLWIAVPMGLVPGVKPGTTEAKELVEIEWLGEEVIWDLPPPEIDLYDNYLNEPISELGEKNNSTRETTNNERTPNPITIEEIEPPRYPELFDREQSKDINEIVQLSYTDEEISEELEEEPLEEWLGIKPEEKEKVTIEYIKNKQMEIIQKAETTTESFNKAKIATLNINGNRNKWQDVDNILQYENTSILIITETHLPDFMLKKFEKINRRYKAISHPGTKDREHYRGGVTMFINTKLAKYAEFNHCSPKNTVHVSIKEPVQYEIIGYYAPSGYNTEMFYTNLREYMETWKQTNHTKGFIIAGDSNATIYPGVDRWKEDGTPHRTTKADKLFIDIMMENKTLPKFIDTLGLKGEEKQKFTFVRYKKGTAEMEIYKQSRIDHVLIEEPLLGKLTVKEAKISNKYTFSDHRLVYATIEWGKDLKIYPETKKFHIPRYKLRNYKNKRIREDLERAICPEGWEELEEKLNYERAITQEEVDKLTKKTLEEIINMADKKFTKTGPRKQYNTNTYANHPRSKQINKAVNTIKFNLKKIRKRNKTNKPHNPKKPGIAMRKMVARIIAIIEEKDPEEKPKIYNQDITPKLLINLRTKLKNKRASYVTKKETQKGTKIKKRMQKLYNKNVRTFYNIMKGGRSSPQDMEVLVDEEGRRIFRAKEKTELAFAYYEELFNHSEEEIKKGCSIKHLFPKGEVRPPNDDLTYPTNIEEINKILKETPNEKAPGPNNIPYEIWRNLPAEFQEALKITYNIALERCIIPSHWNDSYLRPIFKNKGTKTNLRYYRPISLLQTEYKIFTSIITERLAEYMEKNNLFSKIQCGFRKNKGCLDAVYTMMSTIEVAKKNNLELHIVTLDAKSAFDTVPREAKYEALDFQVKDEKLNLIIKRLYHAITTRVILPFGETEEIKLGKGVRQGDTLSPLLFLIFLNPLLLRIEKTKGISIYRKNISGLATADDLALIGKNRKRINNLLDMTMEYFDCATMGFNGDKSNHSYMNAPPQETLMIGDRAAKDLGEEGFCTYLGITFNMKLDWTKQQRITINTWKTMVNMFLKRRMLTTAKIDLINTLANTIFSYNMSLIRYKERSLKEMDEILIAGIKREIGILSRSSRATLTAPIEKGGRGLTLPSQIQAQTTINATVNLLINKEDESVATELVRHIIKEEGLQKTSLTTIKNLKRTLKKNGLSCKLGVRKRKGRWEEIGKSYAPNNKWDINRPHTTFKDSKGNEEVAIWTDGSVHYEKKKIRKREIKIPRAGSAIYLKEGENEIIPSDFGNDSGYAELKAIEITLLSAPWKRIRIFTDSQRSIKDINRWEKFRNVKKRRHKYREIIKRIVKAMKEWEKEGRIINFTHVRSHIKSKIHGRNKKLAKRTRMWRSEIKKQFGKEKYNKIVHGNEQADELAKKAAKKKRKILNIPAGNDFLVILKKGKAVEGSAHQLIKKEWKEKEPKKWKANYLAMNKEMIDPALSWPKYKGITYGRDKDWNFTTKLRRENLKTRREVHRCKPQPHYEESYIRKWNRLYSSPTCIFCETGEEESSRHLFVKCKHWKTKRIELHHLTQLLIKQEFDINGYVSWIFDRGKLVDNIRTLYREEVEEETLLRILDLDEKEMMRGYFPKPIAESIAQISKANHTTTSKKDTRKSWREIQLKIIRFMRNWYNDRCQQFHEKMKKKEEKE